MLGQLISIFQNKSNSKSRCSRISALTNRRDNPWAERDIPKPIRSLTRSAALPTKADIRNENVLEVVDVRFLHQNGPKRSGIRDVELSFLHARRQKYGNL